MLGKGLHNCRLLPQTYQATSEASDREGLRAYALPASRFANGALQNRIQMADTSINGAIGKIR